jgi:hypothetical protein
MYPGKTMSGGSPFQQGGSAANDYTKLLFVFQQLMRGTATATLVRVDACTNDGGLVPTGTVDVTILVNQVDGNGQPVPHKTIYGLPYGRLQGGSTAFIIDPVVGDIGLATFASRDISSVKATKAQSNPASSRVCDYADGLYWGTFFGGIPTQYVQANANGITIHSPTKVTVSAPEVDLIATTVVNIQAPTINLKGAVVQTAGNVSMAADLAVAGNETVGGGLAVTGTTTGTGAASFAGGVTGQGTNLHTHTHPPGSYVAGATPVTGNSAPP